MAPLHDVPAQELFNSFTGHVTPKKSRIITIHGNPDPLCWLKIRQLKNSLKVAAQTRRFKNNERFKRGRITDHCGACPRRFLEAVGLPYAGLRYISEPVLLVRPERLIYELRIGFLPFCSFTDAKEAELSCIAMQQRGYPSAHIFQRDLSLTVP